MKKIILILAITGTFTDVASAQSAVTIYGVVDAGIVGEGGSVANAANRAAGITPGSSRTLLSSGVGYGSRLGFKGTEDLGGGMSAFFNLENDFQADTGAAGQGGLLFGRTALVGIAGGFGAVSMGRQYSGYDGIVWGTDPFNGGYAGKAANLVSVGYTARVNNSVVYRTPIFGNFSADVQYGFGEVAGNTSDSRMVGGTVRYANGPLVVRLGYLNVNQTAAIGGASKNAILGATYDFGPAKVHFIYAVNKSNTAVATTVDSNDVLVGVSVPYGAGKFLASYIMKNDKTALNRDATQAGVGYVYSLSKRTELYAAYGRIDNKNGAVYTVGNSIEPGFGNRAYNLGVTHRF